MGFVRVGIALAIALLAMACGSSNSEPSNPTKEKAVYVRPTAKADVVECLDPKAETPAWISNGAFGIRIGREGGGMSLGGPGRPGLSIANYNRTGEEKIMPTSIFLPSNFRLNGKPVIDGATKQYSQSLVLRNLPDEILTKWAGHGAKFSVRTRLTGDELRYDLSITNADGSYLSMYLPDGPYASIRVNGIDYRSINGSGSRGNFQLTRPDFKLSCVVELQPISKSPLSSSTVSDIADIEIDGPVEDQQAIRSFLTYLRGSVPIDAETPVSPLSTSGTTYNGHVFWDADIWVFPALALLDPERAKTISNYRFRMAKAAERNFKERRSWARSAPTAEAVAKLDALQYPWESSMSGLEVSPTETKQQHHITGDVVWGLEMAAALGLADLEKVEAIGKKAAKFYQFRASTIDHEAPGGPKDATRKFRSILETVSPDEHYFGDHDLYTNAIAEWTIKRFDPTDKGLPFFLPRDGKGYLNYGGDRMKGYKQAAGALAIYPLQNPAVEKEARLFMDRFGDKVSKNGPAMTDSVHALIWARLGEKDKAYSTWRKSWMEFTNHPLMLFSEKRSKDVTYFSTGAAGCLQTVIYGFAGIRIDSKAQPGSMWTVPLKSGKVLSIKPNLPSEWKSLRIKGLAVLGKHYDLRISNDAVRVGPL